MPRFSVIKRTVTEAVSVDVCEPTMELRVTLHRVVSMVIQIHPAGYKPATHTDHRGSPVAIRVFVFLRCARLPVHRVPDPQSVLGVEALRQFVHTAVAQVFGDAQGSIGNPGRSPAEEKG